MKPGIVSDCIFLGPLPKINGLFNLTLTPYTASMRRLFRNRSAAGNILIFAALLAVLLTQGSRLCLHTPHAEDAGHAHATAVHLESDLTSPADSDDANDRHVPLGLALVKQLTDNPAFAALPAAVWALFLPRPNQRFAVPRNAKPLFPVAYRLRPPLRAPPF